MTIHESVTQPASSAMSRRNNPIINQKGPCLEDGEHTLTVTAEEFPEPGWSALLNRMFAKQL